MPAANSPWTDQLAGAGTVEFKNSIGKQVLLLFGALVLSLGGLAIGLGADGLFIRIVGWIAFVLFLLGAANAVRNLFVRRPQVTVTTDGISAPRTFPADSVAWAEIQAVEVVRMNSNDFVQLVLTPAAHANQEQERSAAGAAVNASVEVEGVDQHALWLPNGLNAKPRALGEWLAKEHAVRHAPTA